MDILSNECPLTSIVALTFTECVRAHRMKSTAFFYTANSGCEACLLTSNGNQTSKRLYRFDHIATNFVLPTL